MAYQYKLKHIYRKLFCYCGHLATYDVTKGNQPKFPKCGGFIKK